jgi:hypothetical protein
MFNPLHNFSNLCENLYLMLLMSFLNLKVLKKNPTKSIKIMSHVTLSKNMILGQKNLNKNKNCNSYGLMKIWSNFNHSKIPRY